MNINTIVNNIKKDLHNSIDLKYRFLNVKNNKVAYLYLESVSSSDSISNNIIKCLTFEINQNKSKIFETFYNNIKNTITSSNMLVVKDYEEILYLLSCGFTIILMQNSNKAVALETRRDLSRGVTESSSEAIIRGPKDSFTETHATNLGLIRKRIKDKNLVMEDVFIGKRTKTKITITYIYDLTNLNNIKKIKNKLNKLNIDSVLDTGHIREYLIEKQNTVFPKMISTERPDLACTSLLNGKICILVENTPYILIIPGLFIDFFKNPEDYYQKPLNASITRLLRITAFILTILVPALYISLTTFQINMLPEKLLNSLYFQRLNVPFPTFFEIIILLIIFEILRECDIRTPSKMGASMSIVGGLVLGDAAVSANLVSQASVIIVALTTISGLLFSDIDMINAIRLWRFIFILFSASFGLIGFLICLIILIIKLSDLKVMDIDYLSPISPPNIIGLKDSFIRLSKKYDDQRPNYLSNNINKEGDNNV